MPNYESEIQRKFVSAIITGDLKATEKLLKESADPNYDADTYNCPLGLANRKKKLEIVKCLLEYGADPGVLHQDGKSSVFHRAAACATVDDHAILDVMVDYDIKNKTRYFHELKTKSGATPWGLLLAISPNLKPYYEEKFRCASVFETPNQTFFGMRQRKENCSDTELKRLSTCTHPLSEAATEKIKVQ